MHVPLSFAQALALGTSFLSLVDAQCPFNSGNEALKPRDQQLQKRYNQGSDIGRCSRKSKYASGGTRSSDWWPCELSLAVLRQNDRSSNPMSYDFRYSQEFAKLDCALPNDL